MMVPKIPFLRSDCDKTSGQASVFVLCPWGLLVALAVHMLLCGCYLFLGYAHQEPTYFLVASGYLVLVLLLWLKTKKRQVRSRSWRRS